MSRKPSKSDSNIFAGGLGISILYQGLIEGIITLAVYYIGIRLYSTTDIAITMSFATLGLIQLVHSFNVRSGQKSAFSMSPVSNKYLLLALAVSVLLQLSVIAIPFLNTVFKLTPLSLPQWLIVAGASLAIIPLVEICKIILKY